MSVEYATQPRELLKRHCWGTVGLMSCERRPPPLFRRAKTRGSSRAPASREALTNLGLRQRHTARNPINRIVPDRRPGANSSFGGAAAPLRNAAVIAFPTWRDAVSVHCSSTISACNLAVVAARSLASSSAFVSFPRTSNASAVAEAGLRVQR